MHKMDGFWIMGLSKRICMDPSFFGLLNWPKIRLFQGDLMLSLNFFFQVVSEHKLFNFSSATSDLVIHQLSSRKV